MPSPAGDFKTHLPPLPLEYLREREILADFIRRVNTFGEYGVPVNRVVVDFLVLLI